MDLKKLDDKIELAKNWLLYSGIQNISEEKRFNGGINSWYDVNNKNYPYIFSEIIGYGITTLMFLDRIFLNPIFTERAELATHWLIDNATQEAGGIKTRYYYNKSDWENELLYTFDTGMVLFGVINLYLKTKKEEYLTYAKRLTDFLLSLQKEDGSFYAIYDPKTKEKIDKEDTWSTQSGSYHAKLSLGLLNLFDITKDEKYKKSAVNICKYALTKQELNGRFITFRGTKNTFLHPHCYSAEGLLYTGTYLKEKKFIDAAKKATTWALTSQLENGGIPNIYYEKQKSFSKHECTDEMSQVLRLGCLTLDKNYEEKLEELIERISQLQKSVGDKKVKGGFIYGFDIKGQKYEHLNSWCTMFALQAMIFYKLYKENNLDTNMGLNLLI